MDSERGKMMLGSAKIKRVLLFGKSQSHTQTPRFLKKGFEKNGVEVKLIHYRKLQHFLGEYLTEKYLVYTYHRFQPQLVFIFGTDIPFNVLSYLSGKVKIAIFYRDYYDPLPGDLIEWGRYSDYFFINNVDQLAYLRGLGIRNPIFMTEGCDQDEHRIITSNDPKWKSEVAFIGKPKERGGRITLLREVARHFDLKVWGGDWGRYGFNCGKKDIYPSEFARICSGAKIILGIDVTDKVKLYFSNRTWITLGCGGFLLTRYIPGLEEIFVNRRHLVWYRDIDECLELIGEYLNKDEERARIKQEGYRFVHENYTYKHVAARILEAIK